MQKSLLFSIIFSGIVVNTAYAVNFDISTLKDPNQTEVNSSSSIDDTVLKHDLLRKQQLAYSDAKLNHSVTRFTGKELMDNPQLLEKLFLDALISPNNTVLPVYIKLYERVKNPDRSLIEWANAILLRDKNLNDAVIAYRELQKNFPHNNFIRFQLAETLFYNQEFESARSEFNYLKSSKFVSPQDIVVFDSYIKAINNKEQWSFSFGANFLNDKNLSNAAPQGTQVTLPNGNTITYSSPRQSGKGISFWFAADKQLSLTNGKYLAFESSIASKYYWNNKVYNDINTHIGLGLGYSDARFNISLTPYIDKRWYAGGLNSSESLKQHSNTYGIKLSSSYWLSKNLKYNFLYDFGYEKYDREYYSRQYNGQIHNLTNSLLFLPKASQYWSLSIDLSKKMAKDSTNAYNRLGTRLTWGQDWPLGISTSTTLGFAHRNYKGITFFGLKQKNKEYSASVSLWHKDVQFAGFVPKLTFNYTKTDSNIKIYSYDKKQVYINIGKAF